MSTDRYRRSLSRRALLVGTAAVLAGCARDGTSGDRKHSVDPGPAGPGSGSVEPTDDVAPPATPAAYEPPAGESLPNFKRAAGLFAQGIATYDAINSTPGVPAAPGYVGAAAELAVAAAPLLAADRWSRAEVEVVQYGGLTPVSPSARSGVAIVVLRQVLQKRSGQTAIVRRTLDLRLAQRQGVWQVEELASAGGTKTDRPGALPPSARSVLDDGRIDLPDSARWDVYSGQVSQDLLEVLLTLAAVAPLRATVFKTGHPERVVDGRAAPPVSAHWLGRAVDINAVGGAPVASADRQVLRRLVETAGGLTQVAQIGAPAGLDLDGGRSRRYFSNLVHADHLHIAVRPPNPHSGSAAAQPNAVG